MPELPEVETLVRGLRRVLPGRRILGVRIGKSDFIDEPAALDEMLPGRRIASVERVGKFIRIPLESRGAGEHAEARVSLMVHLGMTGRLQVRSPDEPVLKHTHVFFPLDDGRELRYTDIRRFGRMCVVPEDGLAEFCGRLGIDPLAISAKQFSELFVGRRARIKALLLDQSVLRGVGNIYADESLWRSRIHPARLASHLTPAQIEELRRSLQTILRAAIQSRGSSISDFLDADGRPGGYQRWHRVYQRTGHPCPRCGAAIRHAVIAGRSSHFCPRCQPTPRQRRNSSGPARQTRKGADKRKRRG